MRYIALVALVFLAACKPAPNMPMKETAPIMQSERVSVTRIGVFEDDLAYDNRRGIYVIKDSQTGKEYIGVSGIGITESGIHSCGKSCVQEDER
jgi:hypothetical protein